MNIRLVATVSSAPSNRILTTPKRTASSPPTKPPAIVISRPKVLTTLAISVLLKPRSW